MTAYQPGAWADTDRPAVIVAETGETITYRQLNERSQQLAQLLHAAGLRPGDHLAVMLDNTPRYFEVYWAAQRSGLHITPINWHLKPDEAAYIVQDCAATAFVTCGAVRQVAELIEPALTNVTVRLMIDGTADAYECYEERIADYPAEPLAEEVEGQYMFYSSGTTGRPKGILAPRSNDPFGTSPGQLGQLLQFMYGVTEDTVYLNPAPLYHAAPLGWTTSAQRLGAAIVVMSRFDPAECLQAIERYRITHAQFVPTHFVRMLKLPAETRQAADVSSLRYAVHAAAPCPVEVKRQMIEWWGPVIYEYYSGSEGVGFCALDSEQWLAHPGSVGLPLMGTPHVVDEHGNECPTGTTGQVWFDSGSSFTYHNDPDKTASAYNAKGWTSLGDIGYLDADGYLYLTDRVSHMIISGGVNIYPQEAENELASHPAVADVAVIGVPNADLGEEVKAVVIPTDPAAAGDELAAELIAYCRSRLSHFKCPATVDFVDELPRLPTGKLFKRELRDRYWPATPDGTP